MADCYLKMVCEDMEFRFIDDAGIVEYLLWLVLMRHPQEILRQG